MASNRLRAEINLNFKRDIAADLEAQLNAFFPKQSADINTSFAKTDLAADAAGTLNVVIFARDRGSLVYLYLKEDSQSIKVYIERQSATTLDRQNQDLDDFQVVVIDEIDRMVRFAKKHKYKIPAVNVVVSMDFSAVSTAQQKLFSLRLIDGLKTTSLVSKLGALLATGVAAALVQMDIVSAIKAVLAGIFAIGISVVLEAALGDAFKFQRR